MRVRSLLTAVAVAVTAPGAVPARAAEPVAPVPAAPCGVPPAPAACAVAGTGARDTTGAVAGALAGVATAPAAAPVGWVYFADTAADGRTRIYRTNAGATGATRELVVDAGTFADQPAVSPDGTRLAYVSDGAGGPLAHDVYVRTLATGATVRVAASDADEVVSDPAWSPDGTRLAFSHFQFGTERYSVRQVAADGSAAPAAVRGALDALRPAYSPSGRQLVVTTTTTTPALAVVTPASGARSVVPGTAHATSPAWSPDGRALAFSHVTSAGQRRIVSVPVRGGTATVLTAPPAGSADERPAFSADGGYLYLDRTGAAGAVLRLDLAGGGAPVDVATGLAAYHASATGGVAPADADAGPAPTVRVSVASGSVTTTVSAPAADWSELVVRRSAADAPPPATPGAGYAVAHGWATTATATGLTNGTAYGVSVFAVDAAGNVTPPASFTVVPVAVPAVTAPALVSAAGATATWPVRWAVPTGGGMAASYDVQYGTRTRSSSGAWSAAPAWRAWRTGTTARSASITGAQGVTYWFRVRARSASGHLTGWSVAKPASVPLNESHRALAYSSGWYAASSGSRWLGTYRAAYAAGRTVSLTGDTARFTLVGDRCPTCGRVRVYVDGVLRATVDAYASTARVRQALWSGSFAGGIGRHTVTLVVVGAGDRRRVVVDGIALYR